MKLTSPLPLQDAATLLKSFSSESQFIAFTDVNVRSIYVDKSTLNFTVMRRWRGSKGLFDYGVVSYIGTLTPTEDGESTLVEGQVQLEWMAYVIMVIFVIALLIALLAGGRGNSLGWIVVGFLVAMALLEVYVYSRIRTALQQGYRQ